MALRVLFVEDNPVTQASMTKALKNRGYALRSATDLASALSFLNKGEIFSHLICDYDLAGENGLVVAKKFNELFPKAPISIFTGHESFLQRADVNQFLSENPLSRALHIIYKPIDQEQIFGWLSSSASTGRQ